MIWIPFVAVPAAVALIQLGSMHTMVTFMTLALKLSGVVIVKPPRIPVPTKSRGCPHLTSVAGSWMSLARAACLAQAVQCLPVGAYKWKSPAASGWYSTCPMRMWQVRFGMRQLKASPAL